MSNVFLTARRLSVPVVALLAIGLFAGSAEGQPVPGDLNADGRITAADIQAFVIGVRNPAEWCATYRQPPEFLVAAGDFNCNRRVERDDINGFCLALKAAGIGAGITSVGAGMVAGCDLDIDSDNTNGSGFPDRSVAEDQIEDDPGYAGKLLLVNDDDDDHNSTPDLQQNAAISAEAGDLVPMILEILPSGQVPLPANFDYRLTYPARIRVWRSPLRGNPNTDTIPSGVNQTLQVFILGDMNGDGGLNFGDINPFVLALSDPAAYAQQYPGIDPNRVGDLNGDGVLNFGDINPFVAALTSPWRFTPLRCWVEGLDKSGSQADTRVLAEADTDHQGSYDASDAVRMTVVRLSSTPASGVPGTLVTWTLDPAIAPLSFTAGTTAEWHGTYNPPGGNPTAAFSITYSAQQVRESGPSAAVVGVADGTFTNPPNVNTLAGGGAMRGTLDFHFGQVTASRAFDFVVLTSGADWQVIDYPDGPGGSEPARLGGVLATLPLFELSALPDPLNPSNEFLWGATDFHCAAVFGIDENSVSVPLAPPSVTVTLVTYAPGGAELARASGLVLSKIANDGNPALILYGQLDRPVLFVDVDLNPASYPDFVILRAVEGGEARILSGS